MRLLPPRDSNAHHLVRNEQGVGELGPRILYSGLQALPPLMGHPEERKFLKCSGGGGQGGGVSDLGARTQKRNRSKV